MPSRKAILKTYVTDEECQRITDSARQAGLSVSAFISRVCLGSPVKSKVDEQAVRALVKVNADMGRLGGLLKMWLMDEDAHATDVHRLLNELLALKDELARRIQKL